MFWGRPFLTRVCRLRLRLTGVPASHLGHRRDTGMLEVGRSGPPSSTAGYSLDWPLELLVEGSSLIP
jgi:hypothetical protein